MYKISRNNIITSSESNKKTMSSIILTPLAVLLTYRATNDIGLINMDVILDPLYKVVKKIFPPQN